MEKLKKIGPPIAIVSFIVAITIIIINSSSTKRQSDTKDQEIMLLKRELEEQTVQIEEFQKYIEENAKIPEPGVLDVQGISEEIANRYYLVYVQLMLLAETADAPEHNLSWLRGLVKKGVLHNVLNSYSLIALDDNYDPPRIAANFTVDIDWQSSSLYTELKSQENKQPQNIHKQPTMALAAAFSRIVRQENLSIEMRCNTVDEPNFEALNTLGVPAYTLGLDTTMDISNEDFKSLVLEELNLVTAEILKWREGDERTIAVGSDITPELTVKLKYVLPRKDTMKDRILYKK